MKVHVQITCVIEVPSLASPDGVTDLDIVIRGVEVLGATKVYPGLSVKRVEVNPREELTPNQRRVQLGRRRSATRRH